MDLHFWIISTWCLHGTYANAGGNAISEPGWDSFVSRIWTDLVYLMEFLLITIPDTGVSSSPVSRSSKRFFFKIFGFAGWDVLGWFLWDGIFPARQNKKGTYPVNNLSKCLSKPFKSCSSWLITCIKLAVVHGYTTFRDAPRTIILLLHCLPCESVRFFRFRTETGQSVLIRDYPSCHGLGRLGTKSHIIPDSSSSGFSLPFSCKSL